MMTAEPTRKQLDLDPVFAALETPLGLVDNPDRRAELDRFIRAARVHQERAIFDLASDLVAAVNDAGATRARLEYESGKLYLTVQPEATDSDETGGMFRMDGDMEKVTIRLPAHLKRLIDEIAGGRGVSVNTWYVRTLARSIHMFRGRTGEPHPGEPGGPGGPGRHGPSRMELRWQWHNPSESPDRD